MIDDDGASVASVAVSHVSNGSASSFADFDHSMFHAADNVSVPGLPFDLVRGAPWVRFDDISEPCVPVRAMRFNLPVSLLRPDARSLSDWAAPSSEAATRAHAFAALSSLLYAGTAQGLLSGRHVECEAGDANGDDNAQKPRLSGVNTYVFNDRNGDRRAMFHFGVEMIRGLDGELLALGLWKLVYDEQHSDTDLMSSIICENRSVQASIRGTQTSAIQRKALLAREAKALSSLRDIRTHAGLAYKSVTNVSDLLSLINQLTGAESAAERRACFRAEELAADTLLTPLCGHTRFGGTHSLSQECVPALAPALAPTLAPALAPALAPNTKPNRRSRNTHSMRNVEQRTHSV